MIQIDFFDKEEEVQEGVFDIIVEWDIVTGGQPLLDTSINDEEEHSSRS